MPEVKQLLILQVTEKADVIRRLLYLLPAVILMAIHMNNYFLKAYIYLLFLRAMMHIMHLKNVEGLL